MVGESENLKLSECYLQILALWINDLDFQYLTTFEICLINFTVIAICKYGVRQHERMNVSMTSSAACKCIVALCEFIAFAISETTTASSYLYK